MNKIEDEQTPKATHQGTLEIANMKIPCAVLKDGTRVLSERSVATTLGRKGSGAYWQKKKSIEKGAILPEYISAKYLQPFISDEMREKLLKPIVYKQKNGALARGINAFLLPEICEIWLDAKEKGAIPKSQEKAEKNAEILMRGFARIGIIALIDEATGYQEVRDRLALAKILDKYILDEYRKWTRTFPPEFYKEMFKLKKWPYDEKQIKRPSVIGHYTNDLVYKRLAPGVLKELQHKNPRTSKGYRKQKHTQWLTGDIGIPKVKEHLVGLIALMKAAPNWRKFTDMVGRVYPKYGDTIPMDFEED
ncbi:MAG: P63C domain-containing protein [Ignavibacteriaceae bacterium]